MGPMILGLARKFRESAAILVWLYVFLKLFVLDIDVLLAYSLLPKQAWLLQYRLVLILLVLALFWLGLGTKRFSKNLLYILFYPFIVIFWKIPKFAFHTSTNMLFGIAISSTMAIISAKKWFTMGTFSIIAILLIAANSNMYAAIPGMVFLFLVLLRQYWRNFYGAFSSQTVGFKSLITFLQRFQSRRVEILLGNLKKCTEPEGSADYEKVKSSTMFGFLLFNRLTLFCAHRLRVFRQNRMIVLYGILKIAFTFVMTVLIFGLEYYGLSRFQPTSFTSGPHSLLVRVYYSFGTFIKASVPMMAAQTPIAHILSVAEHVLSLVFGLIVVFIVTLILIEKHQEELDALISSLQEESKTLAGLFNEQFSLSLDALEIDMREKKDATLALIDRIQVPLV